MTLMHHNTSVLFPFVFPNVTPLYGNLIKTDYQIVSLCLTESQHYIGLCLGF